MLNNFYRLFIKFFNNKIVRKFLNVLSSIFKSKGLLTFIVLFLLLESFLYFSNYKISVNISESLPFRVFLIDCNKNNLKNIKNGDYIQFINRDTNYYNGEKITKQVFASSNDVLEIKQLEEPINNIQAMIIFNGKVLDVKDKTTLGTKVHTNNINVIPENHYFVIGLHKNSFDSRYAEFGLISKEEIIGVAKPLF